jgi:hypothetical protein
MSEKRNSPAGEATPAGAKMEPFEIHSSTARPGVSTVLGKGREAALTANEIATLLGYPDARAVTLEIEMLRKQGLPICASCSKDTPGFFFAKTPGELYAYLCSLRRRIGSMNETADALDETLAEWTGQLRLW